MDPIDGLREVKELGSQRFDIKEQTTTYHNLEAMFPAIPLQHGSLMAAQTSELGLTS